MVFVNDPRPNGHTPRKRIKATDRREALVRRQANGPAGANGQAGGYGSDPASVPNPAPDPPPAPASARTRARVVHVKSSPAAAPAAFAQTPAPESRSADGSTMDLRLYARVMWRFKFVMALGLIIGIAGAYMLYEGGGSAYKSRAQVFITQPGFTWGMASSVPSSSANGSSSAGSGNSSTVFPYVPGVDPQRLAALATLYAQLAGGSALRNLLPAVYRDMLKPTSGTPTATLSPNAVTASEFANPATLPLVTFWATAPTPGLATGLASAATDAFRRLVTQQQAAVALQSRVVAQVVQTATPGAVSGHKSKSLPIMVFMAGLLGAFGLSLVLENTRPRVAGERKRKLGRRKHARATSEETSVRAVSPADGPAEDVSFAESSF